MDGSDSPIPGPGAGFPGEFFLFDYNDGTKSDFYSFGIGLADYTEPYVLAEAVNAAFFTFESGFQIILDEHGFAIIEEGGSTTALNGYFVGSLAFQAVGSEIEFENYPDFFSYPGTAGPDTLLGSEFNDRFLSSAGADAMSGGAGDDRYYVDNAADAVIEGAGGGTDRSSPASATRSARASMSSCCAPPTSPAPPRSTSPATSSPTLIYGNAGTNVLDGGAGADTLVGLGGDDCFYVDNAGDVVIEARRRRHRPGLRQRELHARRRRPGRAADDHQQRRHDRDQPDRQRARQHRSTAMPAPTCSTAGPAPTR